MSGPACLRLTERQREVMSLRLDGLGRREVAHRLRIVPKTVRKHIDDARLANGAPDELRLLVAYAIELETAS